MTPHTCPSLIVCICCDCNQEYQRKDGLGVSNGSTQPSHGMCPHCFDIRCEEEMCYGARLDAAKRRAKRAAKLRFPSRHHAARKDEQAAV